MKPQLFLKDNFVIILIKLFKMEIKYYYYYFKNKVI